MAIDGAKRKRKRSPDERGDIIAPNCAHTAPILGLAASVGTQRESSTVNDMALHEHLLIDAEIFRKFDDNLAFKKSMPGHAFPPIAFMCDAHGNWDYEGYRRTGIKGARMIAGVVKAHMRRTTGLSIYEWGCGPARIIRYLREILGPNKYFASDYNRSCIEWCSKHIDGVTFFPNDLFPPLDLADQSMDFVYCRSVFTHLTKANGLAWIKELTRITKPGGIISFTTASDKKLDSLKRSFPDRVASYERGEVVEIKNSGEGLRGFASFHPPQFVRNEMLADLTLIEHSVTNQDEWVARR